MPRHQCTPRCGVTLADGGHACVLTLVGLEGSMSCERIALLTGMTKQGIEHQLWRALQKLEPRARLVRLGD